MKNIIQQFLSGLMIVVLLMTAIAAVLPTQNASAATSSKQIVFTLEDKTTLKFTSVTITGYDQNKQLKTWTKQDPYGFTMAYTKSWWWSANFVEIKFTVLDLLSKKSYAKTCLIDVLQQPADSPRVEIMYYRANVFSTKDGCVGGEAGSAQNPIQQKVIGPIHSAYNTIDYYLPDDKFDFFMKLLSNELNATGCVLGVAAAVNPATAVSSSLLKAYIVKTCVSTGNMMADVFTKH